jgi:cytosine/adenosine deaminase-related metal-dependent hydrolase
MTQLTNSPMSARLYRARWVLPMSGPAVEDGAVSVRGSSIEAVSRFGDLKADYPADSLVDLGDAAIFPGLVNAHTHLDNSALRGRIPKGLGMISWYEAHRDVNARIPDDERVETCKAAWHSLPALGTIALADISYEDLSSENIGEELLYGWIFFEISGFSRKRADEHLKAALERQARAQMETSRDRFRIALAPHGLHSLHESALREVFESNLKRDYPVSIHLAESPQEVGFLTGDDTSFEEALKRWGYWEDGYCPPKCSPIQYLNRLGWLGPDLLAIHCVQVGDSDMELLAESGAAVCLCPRSNDHIGIGQPRIAQMTSMGIQPCLGTDGLASNSSLSLFDEMAFVRDRHPDVQPEDLLKMATVNAAKALRLNSLLGTLEPLKAGRFLVYPVDTGDDPFDVLTSEIDLDKLLWVGGGFEFRD